VRTAAFIGVIDQIGIAVLDVGLSFDGPAIIDQLDATTVVPPGQSARVDEFKNILIAAGSV